MTVEMQYITRSNLIVGELSRLRQASKENASYELTFFGTTLDCETTDRSIEGTVTQMTLNYRSSDLGGVWWIDYPEPNCTFYTKQWSKSSWTSGMFESFPGDASITYHIANYTDPPRYWPCLDKNRWMPTLNESLPMAHQEVRLPGSGIHFTVPATVTKCLPKIVEYHVTISNTGGAQLVSFVIKDDESIPTYTANFADLRENSSNGHSFPTLC
jgi:hypothetical protein